MEHVRHRDISRALTIRRWCRIYLPRICIPWNFNYGVRAYQTIIAGSATCGIVVPPSFRGPYVPLRWCPARARARVEIARLSFERDRASHVIFIEWVDTHYFALQGPYEGYDIAPAVRIERNDRALTTRENSREISRASAYNFAQIATNGPSSSFSRSPKKFRRDSVRCLWHLKIESLVNYKSTRLHLSNELERVRRKGQVKRIQLSLLLV